MIKILVVDDELDVCDFVKSFFTERDFKVLTALSGEEALRAIRKENPHIVLLDMKMKGMDGLETLKRIRQVDKSMKVIMVTAVDEHSKMDVARKLGVSKYITKPLVLEELEAAVIENTKGVKDA